ncbi:hypothetical protein BGT96224_A21106 [Blumeria graminis f. sp. tritici 96224]|uniref:Uncharacterized protein n=1 Tax=Blumeria graminis f. sp. tritici 96224 TaxID=1268274 RepID=A0A656KKQ8_BLUGR|nr:hypothetical protein BGT96224_A21106 [Blumeria graminis f. sp. tritici 96224]
MSYFQTFLVNFEGIEEWSEETILDETEQLLMKIEIDDLQNRNFFAEFGEIDGAHTVAILKDQLIFHAITKADVFKKPNGIMPDSGAAGVSSVGASECAALQQLNPSVQIDTSTAVKHQIRFGKGEELSQGSVTVSTP